VAAFSFDRPSLDGAVREVGIHLRSTRPAVDYLLLLSLSARYEYWSRRADCRMEHCLGSGTLWLLRALWSRIGTLNTELTLTSLDGRTLD
jgi:hypothetical protein